MNISEIILPKIETFKKHSGIFDLVHINRIEKLLAYIKVYYMEEIMKLKLKIKMKIKKMQES